VIVYLSAFAIVWILGNLLDTAFWQARFHADHILAGKPLPAITKFFIDHHHLPPHLVLFPWIGFVGAPLLTRATSRSYWDLRSFALRFLAFLSSELLLFLVFLFALFIPFVPYYGVLEPFRQSTIELWVRIIFWCSLAATVALFLFRIIQVRNDRKG
jgi:hypothetical protein